MPRCLYDACLVDSFDVSQCADPVALGLSAIDAGEYGDVTVPPDSVFFQVVNAFPERRHNMLVGHIAASKWKVNVAVCSLHALDAKKNEWVVSKAGDGAHKTLDVRGLVGTMRSAVSSVLRWCRL